MIKKSALSEIHALANALEACVHKPHAIQIAKELKNLARRIQNQLEVTL